MARRDSFGGYEEERFKDKVDIKLQCSICLKVLKDPVQCPNEHYFCHSCIRKCLHENAETCPMCQHHLTEETLTKPPRILTDFLQSLMIRCDHENRGCPEFVKLEFLDRHVNSCGYSPTPCTNAGCEVVMNRHEKERHEREQCQFRKIVCDECGEQVIWKSSRVHPCFMRKEMDDLARRLNVVQNYVKKVIDDVKDVEDDVREVKDNVKDVKEDVREVKDDVRNVKEDVREVNDEVKLTQEEMACITKEATERSEWFTGKQKIFVCGGYDGKTSLNSVESFNWPENSWTLEPAMQEARSSHSSFIHGREIYVGGGRHGAKVTDNIETLNIDEENIEWTESPVKMPLKCRGHKMVRHENSAILTGGLSDGDNVSDAIYEISLDPPHNSKLLTQMPEPRCFHGHGCEIVNNRAIVAGGQTSNNLKDAKNTVYVYDLNNNECKTLPPLPFPISGMASVSYKSNVILIGGVNEKGQTLNSVVMYDVKTGKIKMLPCLNHKRARSAAVITGNVIIVMGGYDYETKTYLNSVECLDLSSNVWRELSPMTTKRKAATAVLKSIS
ncbi:E3 ubiquitin- ligase PDZRN3-like [Paramuricea clavata]|uniref:E3 ubiquitin- ligase PDZRN3-like n=1 Tax=Paramuricea clavata TaxID=317549 RepID=A0A7D9JNN0_PARCT|nr:E3 ubiquitin- ligase PDZRN3-like [Paramuricea clavata]